MSAAQHTQGPWEVGARIPGNRSVGGMIPVGPDDGSLDASAPVFVNTHYYEDEHGNPGEADANARLIAAAPDMLAFVNELYGYFYMGHQARDLDEGYLVNKIAALRAKAGGRS